MTPTGETILAYSGGVIDRAANQRSDPGRIDATLARPGTRLIPMWRDQCVVSGEPTRGGHGGHLRTCQNEACARLHFPRVEPAVIMLVENQGTPRKCLL